MLGKWPNPNKLSEMFAWARGLWIRRVLVRAQEAQWLPRQREPFFLGFVLQRLRRFRIEPRRGNSKRDAGLCGVALRLFGGSVSN
jgi:hypothetical protein